VKSGTASFGSKIFGAQKKEVAALQALPARLGKQAGVPAIVAADLLIQGMLYVQPRKS